MKKKHMNRIVSIWSGQVTLVRTMLALALLVFTQTGVAQTQKTAIVGTWLNEEKVAKIEIYQHGEKFFGKIVWLKEPNENGRPKTDQNNPDKAKHKTPILGLQILKDFEFTGKSTWENGTIYDPKNGKTYSCYLILQPDKTLKVRGYVGVSMLGRTTIWTRAN